VKGVVAAGAGEATYRLTLRQEPAAATRAGATPFRATGQDVVRVEDPRTHVVRVRRVLPQASAPRPVTPPPGQEDCLLATTYVQSDAEAIRNLAREVAGKEADSWRAAKLLERWVHENVTEKNLETAFATAIEVLQSREGDCTEHAVLLAALARAAGIPARVVAGLVYSQRAFVGHMWTEVYVGEWVPLDATLGKGAVGADHIALATSSLSSASLADLFLDLLQSLGNLQIEVLSSR
jgi:transglutaminase-like putative cysteine protease